MTAEIKKGVHSTPNFGDRSQHLFDCTPPSATHSIPAAKFTKISPQQKQNDRKVN